MIYIQNNSKMDGDINDGDMSFSEVWAEFQSRFPTTADCTDDLFIKMARQGLISCRRCNSLRVEKAYGSRTFRCTNCSRVFWFTSQSFFRGIKVPRAWMAAIWLKEHGVCISPFRFARLVGVAYATAHTIFKKLGMVIQTNLDSNCAVAPSKAFEKLLCKRSSETPARSHPAAELDAFASDTEEKQESDLAEHPGSVEADNLSGIELEIYQSLLGEPAEFDELCRQTGLTAAQVSCAVMGLELKSLVKREAGNRYVRIDTQNQPETFVLLDSSGAELDESTSETIKSIKNFIRNKYHGISQKWLQTYVAYYWCFVDRIRWGPGCLLKSCLERSHITYNRLLEFVSPANVKVKWT